MTEGPVPRCAAVTGGPAPRPAPRPGPRPSSAQAAPSPRRSAAGALRQACFSETRDAPNSRFQLRDLLMAPTEPSRDCSRVPDTSTRALLASALHVSADPHRGLTISPTSPCFCLIPRMGVSPREIPAH